LTALNYYIQQSNPYESKRDQKGTGDRPGQQKDTDQACRRAIAIFTQWQHAL
jgi:hypothetical protein